MPNSDSIPPHVWEHAREVLVFYFSRRHGLSQAEDLAQETLATLWARKDFEFAREEDFLRVCLGFARRISLASYRNVRRDTHAAVEDDVASPRHDSAGAPATEAHILLEEVKNIGSSQLSDQEWSLILHAAGIDGASPSAGSLQAVDANRFRVYLHRARRKLASLAGWRAV